MKTTERLQEIVHLLEDAISYCDIGMVTDAKDELIYVIEDLNNDYPDSLFVDEDF